MGKLERARIHVLKGDGTKDDVADYIEVCFNPKEYSLEKSVSWDTAKTFSDAPDPEFKDPQPMTLSVTLQFDTYEERTNVRDKWVRKIEALTMMKGDAATEKDVNKHAPPRIKFIWGKMSFRGVIESLSQKYTMFLSDGTPVRAECAVKIRNVQESKIDDAGTSFASRTAGSSPTSYTVQKGDRLDLIAADQLGNAGRWAEIAALNGIDNPMDLDDWVGKSIQVPSE